MFVYCHTQYRNENVCNRGKLSMDASLFLSSLHKRRSCTCWVKERRTLEQFQPPEDRPQQLLLQQLLHLMCRVEKSTWYIFKKTLYSRDTPSCSAPCKYLEIQRSSFLKFQYQATQNCLLCNTKLKEKMKHVVKKCQSYKNIYYCAILWTWWV